MSWIAFLRSSAPTMGPTISEEDSMTGFCG